MKRWHAILIFVFLWVPWYSPSAIVAIIDQTQTETGDEFFQKFVTYWKSFELSFSVAERYKIYIKEVYFDKDWSMGWGNWIWIGVSDFTGNKSQEMVYNKKIFRSTPRDMEETVREGAEAVKKYLLNRR